MKKINDRPVFFYAGLISLVIASFLGLISCYSIYFVENKVTNLIESKADFNKNYQAAFSLLKTPQLFAHYDFFDAKGEEVKKALKYFKEKQNSGLKIEAADKEYLKILLKRREQGSTLGLKTMIYFSLISVFSWLFFLKEGYVTREKK